MIFRMISAAAMLIASTSLAQAAWTSDQIVQEYRDQGYTRIEIDISPSFAKVEAIKGSEKIEVTYDLATGAILKQEVERVDGDDSTAPGTSIRERDNGWFGGDDHDGNDRFDDDDNRGGSGRDHDDDDDSSNGDDDSGQHGGGSHGDDDNDDGDDDDGGGDDRGRGRDHDED